MDTYNKIQEAVQFIQSKSQIKPKVGIVLGTGLGSLSEEVTEAISIPYKDIPHFPLSTVDGHAGNLILGKLNGKEVVMMSGRFHYYEGYSMQQVVFPIRVMKFLGIETVIISNASGGLNPDYQAGDILLIRDHINLQADTPLRGPNDDRIGPRFPDMLNTYDKDLIQHGLTFAKKNNYRIHQGVYISLQGPSLETPAEYQYLHRIGGDVVGMSTVPEVIAAKHMDLKIAGISIVSNVTYPIENLTETTLEEVIAIVEKAAPIAKELVKELLGKVNFE